MNWDALGAIGEIVGALGVLVTLVFLAIQVKANTNSVSAQSELEMSLRMADWHGRVSQNPQLGPIVDKGISSPLSLCDEDKYLFLWFIAEYYLICEGCFSLYLKKTLSESSWRSKRDSLIAFLGNPIIKQWWEKNSTPFTDEFIVHLNEHLYDSIEYSISNATSEKFEELKSS